MRTTSSCWLKQHGYMEKGREMPPCDGRLIRAHLIPQQRLKKRGLDPADPATWVPACGGLVGLSGHHGMFDVSRKLRVAFSELPRATVEYAAAHNLLAWLESNYA